MHATAVITGGTSGIGRAFARAFAERGYDIIITGRRRKVLEATAAEIRAATGRKVETTILELTDARRRSAFGEFLGARDDVEVLINNAGFGLSAEFDAEHLRRHLDMVEVHVRATLEFTAAVLPGMRKRRSGAIINVSSVAGFFPMPRGSIYSASKAFLISFSESLAMEVRKDGIRVQALCPGMTRTDFHDHMGVSGKEITQRRFLVWMSPERVVEASLGALRRNRVVCIPGVFNRVVARVFSHTPRRIYYRLVAGIRK